MAPSLEKRFAMRGYIATGNICDLKAIKSGPSRLIVPISGGFIKGQGVEAEVLPSGADWPLIDPLTNVAHLDVRAQGRASNGHCIFVHYTGVLRIDEAISKVLTSAEDAKTTNFGDHHWYTAPIFETSDPSLKWIEDASWVGQGRVVVDERGSAVDYEIYQAVN